MIPYAIMGCIITTDWWKEEVRVLELAVDAFTFRLSADIPAKQVISASQAEVFFYSYDKKTYLKTVLLSGEYEITEKLSAEDDIAERSKADYYAVYSLKTKKELFGQYSRMVTAEYMRYIRLKTEEEDAVLSQELVGYPAESEEEFSKSPLEQKKKWISQIDNNGWNGVFGKMSDRPVCVGLCIDNAKRVDNFLSMEVNEYISSYYRANGLSEHEISGLPVRYIYIGNMFCYHLFPKQQLTELLDKVFANHLIPVLVFPPLKENELRDASKLLPSLDEYISDIGRELEIVVNDWGMLFFINGHMKTKRFCCTLGVLLNKCRKDTRWLYKYAEDRLHENAVGLYEYRDFLQKKHGIYRVEYECGHTGHKPVLPGTDYLPATLYLPFFQTNTSGQCTLRACVEYGDRGHQVERADCPQYCRDKVFMYPDGLHMAGRNNSLVGYDVSIWNEPERIHNYLRQGMDRIVINM